MKRLHCASRSYSSLLLAGAILLQVNFLPAQAIPIAVVDFESFGISQTEAIALTNRLRNELFRLGIFEVVERGMMESILTEQDFQLTGCTTDECLVEVGRLLGAREIVGGSISKVGGTFTVSARRVDVESGMIIGVSDYDLKGALDDLLTRGMRAVAHRLAGLEGREPVAARPPVPGTVTEQDISGRLTPARMSPEKDPKTAFLWSLFIPGAGQWYINDPTINTTTRGTWHFSMAAGWWVAVLIMMPTYEEEKSNADHLFAIDPGGMDSTIYDDFDKLYKSALAWQAEADVSKRMVTYSVALAVVTHVYSAINARRLAEGYNSRRNSISFYYDPHKKESRLVYYYTF